MIEYDSSAFARIEDYIQGGSCSELSSDDDAMLQAMHEMNSMRRKYGRKKACSYFRNKHRFSYRQAESLYENTINIFYADDGLEKKAMRNMLADEILRSAEVVRAKSKCAKDMEIYAKMITQAYIMKGLDKEDPDEVKDARFEKQIVIYSTDSSMIKMPLVDRNELAEQIDSMSIPQKEKQRLKKESLVTEVSFVEILDETNLKANK